MGFAETKSELIKSWDKIPAAKTCLKLLDFLERTPVAQMQMLTFTSLCNAIEEKQVSEDLIAAVTVLTSSRIYLLEARALFIDDDETEYELSSEEMRTLVETGELIHPDTGNEVAEPEHKVVPFFVPSTQVLSWRE